MGRCMNRLTEWMEEQMQRVLNVDQLCTIHKWSQIQLGGWEGREREKERQG